MILYGALAAISPALEEAAQTLRASRGRVFRTVTWPLLRPALANAFLLGFVESLADFGNPIVLAGNFDVLSTKIFFAVAGAQHDPVARPRWRSVLLGLTLLAFLLQQRWIGTPVVRDGQRQRRRRRCRRSCRSRCGARASASRPCGSFHAGLLRGHLRPAASSRTSAAAT